MPSDRPRRSGVRPRVCTWCPRTFTKDEHLSRHIRTHTRERPFSCEICSKTFSRHDSLLRHTRSHRDVSPKQGAPRQDSLTDPLSNASFAPMRDPQTTPSTYQDGPSTLSIDATEIYQISPEKNADHHTGRHHACAAPSPNSMSSALHSTVRLCDDQNPPHTSAWLHTVTEPIQQAICEPSLSGLNTSLWTGDPAAQVPFWIAADDFDLDAINSAILWSTSNFVPPGHTLGEHNEPPNRTVSSLFESETQSREEAIRRNWFTYIGEPHTGYTTPDTDLGRVQVNEEYRGSLVAKLQYHSSNQPLPSTDFLNLCIQIYLTKVHPIFPIVHVPTFRPSAKSSLLLLSICSVGSLFVGSPNATAQGQRLFETLNKAILSSWENYIVQPERGPESVSMIQAALIGQTYGFLSGKPKDVIVAQTFHGTLLAWARQCNMFQVKRASAYVDVASITDNPEKAWKTWRFAEERNRIAGAIHIHDVEMSELFFTDTYLRHSISKMPPISKDELWAAPSAHQWAKMMISQLSVLSRSQNNTPPETPSISRSGLLGSSNGSLYNEFQGYVELEGIAASIPKGAQISKDPKSRHDLEEWLLSCHESTVDPRRDIGPDTYRLRPMWHSIFISLYADMDNLELAIGRGGSEEAQSAKDEVRRWASSEDGNRCALHAMCILKTMEQTSLGCEPPMHIPRIIFRAALVWFCYTTFGSDLPDTSPTLLFPELTRLGINCKQLLFEANGFSATRPRTAGSSTFCRLIDCLTRIGHWGISKRFASILSLLLPDTGGN